ncbi:hypothetical protein M1O19_05080 [Dehalococcoidia bacterium]|nr:hypothetical protein [Dehalococcoidia bacterium]
MNKLTQTMLGVLLCVAMVVALMPATVAAAGEPVRSELPPITDPPRIPEPPVIIPPYPPEWSPEKGAEILQAIETAERFLQVNPDGTLTLNMPRQAIKSIGEDIYAQLQAALTQSNKMVSQGYLKFDEHFNAQVTEKYLQSIRTAIALDPELSSVVSGVFADGNTIGILTNNGGVNQVTWWGWWGWRLYMCDSTTDDIVTGLLCGIAFTGLFAAALPPAATALGVFAIIQGFAAGMLSHHNQNNTGVRISFLLPMTPVGIDPQ